MAVERSVCVVVIAIYSLLHAKAGYAYNVTTDVGTFTGFVGDVELNGTVKQLLQFRGIPFAEPPVGEGRFAKPIPKAPLDEIYNATYFRPACLQVLGSYNEKTVEYAEDCLYLNIFIPGNDTDIDANRYSVMIWIYGGSFESGYSQRYIPDVLSVYGNVIVVTFNYRLAVFGFLNSGDSVAPGNYGLWDQHFAIKWVHNHISNFGGDPESVTIFGESAGAFSVLYQAMYIGNKGLFQRALAQSGTSLSPGASSLTPQAHEFGKAVGCEQMATADLMKCLRLQDSKVIVDALNLVPSAIPLYVPTVDKDFVKRTPRETIQDKSSEEYKFFTSLDFLSGVNNLESSVLFSFWMSMFNINDFENFPVMKEQLHMVAVPMAVNEVSAYQTVHSSFGDALRFQYTDWLRPNDVNKNRDQLLQLTSDTLFFVPAIETADVHALDSQANTSTFFYLFIVPGFIPPERSQRPGWMNGALHADDIWFVFGLTPEMKPPSFNSTFSQNERRVAEETMKLFTNFAKTGDPNRPMTPDTVWPTYNAETRDYLEIGPISNIAKQRFNEPYTSFWTYFMPLLNADVRNETAGSSTPIMQETTTTDPQTTSTTTSTMGPTTSGSEELFSSRFNIDSKTADDVILALVVVCCGLFVFVVIICGILVRKQRNSSYKYGL